MTFLLVDDNLILSQSIKNYLGENGHNCNCIQDGTLVMDWLDRNPCDAVLMDIRMPELDGITLTRMIHEKRPSLPILIATSVGYDEELLQAALKAGASGYINKVMGPKALLIGLLQAVGNRGPSTS